jgi:hypothetical protein
MLVEIDLWGVHLPANLRVRSNRSLADALRVVADDTDVSTPDTQAVSNGGPHGLCEG